MEGAAPVVAVAEEKEKVVATLPPAANEDPEPLAPEPVPAPSAVEAPPAPAPEPAPLPPPELPPAVPEPKAETVKVEEDDDGDLEGMMAAVKHRDTQGGPKKRKFDDPSALGSSQDTIPSSNGTATTVAEAPVNISYKTIRISAKDLAPGMTVGDDGKSVSSKKGFRTCRTNLFVTTGTHVCEVVVRRLGETGHARLGFGTKRCELQAPIGFDAFGYGYRDVDGSRVHKALRSEYGEGFKEGDVIGMVLHLPVEEEERVEGFPGSSVGEEKDAAGAAMAATGPATQASALTPAPIAGPIFPLVRKPVPKSKIIFFKNGAYQGVAFSDLMEDSYYPCGSLYTMPEEDPPASLLFNFGETEFAHDYADVLRKLDPGAGAKVGDPLDQAAREEIASGMKSFFDHKMKMASVQRP